MAFMNRSFCADRRAAEHATPPHLDVGGLQSANAEMADRLEPSEALDAPGFDAQRAAVRAAESAIHAGHLST